MSTITIPTSGVGRRRAKAIRNRRAVYDADVLRAFERNTFPHYAIACDGCSCGWKQWLMPGATAADWEAYYLASGDHQYSHTWEDEQ